MGCGAERRRWRIQRGGASAAVEKIEQASSAKIFSGTARRTEWETDLPREKAVDFKVFASRPHSSPPQRGKELERRRWRIQRQFLGERQEQCERTSEAVRLWSDMGKTGVVVRPSVLQHGRR